MIRVKAGTWLAAMTLDDRKMVAAQCEAEADLTDAFNRLHVETREEHRKVLHMVKAPQKRLAT
jgi:hypothetical protein